MAGTDSKIRLTLVLEASAWSKPDKEGNTERTWIGGGDDTIASRVVLSGGYWPFRRFEWSAWSPFDNKDDEAIESGSARTEAQAHKEADEALRGLVAAAEASNPAAPTDAT